MSLISITNELIVSNVKESIDFYKNTFNFEIEYTDGNPITWAQLKKDEVRIMLEDYVTVKEEINIFPEKVKSCNLIKFEYDNYNEFKSLYDNCKKKLCSFFIDYNETDYGKIEFGVLDIDDNMILISFRK